MRISDWSSDVCSSDLNLLQQPPRIFVVLRQNADPAVEHEVIPYLVTADAYEGEHYGQAGDEIVDAVSMPPEVMALVADFVKVHHVEEVFVKRKRKKAKNAEDESFSRRPRSEEHTSELPSLMRHPYAVFCL